MNRHDTQHLSLTIKNNLAKGIISLKNLTCVRGQPYENGETLRIISPEDVNQISISHGQSTVVSICGSAAFGLGIEGMLDLCLDGESLITSLYWRGPWKCTGNELHLVNVDEEHYVVKASPPRWEGILGDLAVEISEICASDSLQ